jgi:tetratricopeptide (TPR) repeat protein
MGMPEIELGGAAPRRSRAPRLGRCPVKGMRWLAPVAVFAVLLLALGALNRSATPATPVPPDLPAAPPGDTRAQIAALQGALAADPSDSHLAALLGGAYYQRARETADPAFYTRAEEAYAQAVDQDPGSVEAVSGESTLALARHDFAGGLRLARQAHALAPALVAPYLPLFDAEIELGRYGAAERTLNRMLALKPSLSSYARASYFGELQGDLPGALEAMRLAADAGAGAPESEAYVLCLLGKLQLDLGRYGAADRSYRQALAGDPGYGPARAGRARVAAARGDLDRAVGIYRAVVERLPLPEYAIALGETAEAAGDLGEARRAYALVSVEAKLLASAGVDTDVDLALFEADHGSAPQAVILARRAMASAPSVRSADALSWALHRAGRDGAAARVSAEAMRLGSRDPSFLFHAGTIALASGDRVGASRLLGLLVAQSPRFNPLYGPEAERALEGLR